jgi:hypothetical protein
MCVDSNKLCGIIDNIDDYDLDRLWSKAAGACG